MRRHKLSYHLVRWLDKNMDCSILGFAMWSRFAFFQANLELRRELDYNLTNFLILEAQCAAYI